MHNKTTQDVWWDEAKSVVTVRLDVNMAGRQCESTDMPCGVLLHQYEMPWLFFFLKRQTQNIKSSTQGTEVLLHYLNAISLNQNICTNYNMYQIVW